MKIIWLSAALLIATPFADASALLEISGTISSVTVGEFDPFVVGDACLIEVRTDSGRNVALLTDHESCLSNLEELTQGRGLVSVFEKEARLKDPKALSVLKKTTKARAIYQVEFGTIENGLADEPAAP